MAGHSEYAASRYCSLRSLDILQAIILKMKFPAHKILFVMTK